MFHTLCSSVRREGWTQVNLLKSKATEHPFLPNSQPIFKLDLTGATTSMYSQISFLYENGKKTINCCWVGLGPYVLNKSKIGLEGAQFRVTRNIEKFSNFSREVDNAVYCCSYCQLEPGKCGHGEGGIE